MSSSEHVSENLTTSIGDEDVASKQRLDIMVSDESSCSARSIDLKEPSNPQQFESNTKAERMEIAASPDASTVENQAEEKSRELSPSGPTPQFAATNNRMPAKSEIGQSSTADATDIQSALHLRKDDIDEEHMPRNLPSFVDPRSCMWTSSHAANCPSEDRSASLVNILLRPNQNGSLPSGKPDNRVLVRLCLWSVIDGHGGGSVATYIAEVLLPHIAASISRSLDCSIVDRGVCTVNGELRDANALDLDGLIRTSDRSRANPSSIHYRSPSEVVDQEEELAHHSEEDTVADVAHDTQHSVPHREEKSHPDTPVLNHDAHSISSIKTSVKTAASVSHRLFDTHIGTHAPSEVSKITRAITDSFLAVDEGWINSIDPITTHQTSCQVNGKWNAGACALVAFTVQRLEWTSTAIETAKPGAGEQDARDDTSHNKDAARRRMLDHRAHDKSACSMSTISSSSELTMDDTTGPSAFESEITETEDEYDDVSKTVEPSRKTRTRTSPEPVGFPTIATIPAPGGCDCHVYRAGDPMLYTAHVGDCRAVLLGTAPPRTIKVPPMTVVDHSDTTDEESSYHSSDETECLSSSDHEAQSSDEEDLQKEQPAYPTSTSYMNYMRRPSRRCRRTIRDTHTPFVALPPLRGDVGSMEEYDSEGLTSTSVSTVKIEGVGNVEAASRESPIRESRDTSPPFELPPFTRPIDLTTDHSAYNPSEVSAVLKRCKNAPKAISAGVGGGIKRVAGSLAVTRAFGDAYLKTPLLSFNPYKRHAPYITARPEVNCRLLAKDGDRVLIIATDGVWERCNGEDVLRWVRNYSAERKADVERRLRGRRGPAEKVPMEVQSDDSSRNCSSPQELDYDTDAAVGQKRDRVSPIPESKKRKIVTRSSRRKNSSIPPTSNAADVVVRRVLNKVRRARNMDSLSALMNLPKGRARRSKHDDITASVIDLSAFVS